MLVKSGLAALAALALWAAGSIAQATELVMVRADWCAVCERWEDEVGVIYHKTPESQAAPLRRVEYGAAEIDRMDLKEKVVFTPTFILVEDDVEIARINGYISDHFFWGELDQLLKQLPATPDGEPSKS